MKAYELRLGNWVECKGVHYQIFDGLGTFVIKGLCNLKANKVLIDVPLLSLNSIPITEEILLKAGFEKKVTECKDFRVDITHYQKDKHYVYLIPDGFEFEYETGQGRVNLCKVKKYVHELQNLYFALTCEELNINL